MTEEEFYAQLVRLIAYLGDERNKALDEACKWENIARQLAEKQGIELKEKGEKI